MSGTRALVSTGTASWTTNNIYGGMTMAAGNVYTNKGTFTVSTANNPQWSGGTFNNQGTFIKTSTDSNVISSIFNNSGTLSINSGVLTLQGGGTHSGSFKTTGSAALSFSGTHNFNSGASVNASNLTFAGGTSTFNSNSSINVNTNLLISAGALVLANAATYNFDPLPAIAHSGSGTTATYSAMLNLANSKLIVQSSDAADKATRIVNLNRAISQGASGTTWAGNGITSSIAAADPAHYAVGVFDNAILGLTSFGGTHNVDANSILIAASHLGDANRNGVVDIQDQSIVTNNWQKPASNWAAGDLNRDGFVDLQDLTLITNNWQQSSSFGLTTDLSFVTSSSIPEPLSLPLLFAALPVLCSRGCAAPSLPSAAVVVVPWCSRLRRQKCLQPARMACAKLAHKLTHI